MPILVKTIAAFTLFITSLSASAFANTYQHIDQLALSIDQKAKQIVRETRHYRHTSEYQHLVADALEMSQLADHLHEVAHHHGSVAHMESDLARLDSKFHHLESVFDRIERRAAHGHGHVHGNTSHVKWLLNSIEDSIHHLQEDVRSLRTPIHSARPVVVPRWTFDTTPRSSRWGGYNTLPQSSGFGHGSEHDGHDFYRQRSRGRGITFGGGSSRFTIRL